MFREKYHEVKAIDEEVKNIQKEIVSFLAKTQAKYSDMQIELRKKTGELIMKRGALIESLEKLGTNVFIEDGDKKVMITFFTNKTGKKSVFFNEGITPEEADRQLMLENLK